VRHRRLETARSQSNSDAASLVLITLQPKLPPRAPEAAAASSKRGKHVSHQQNRHVTSHKSSFLYIYMYIWMCLIKCGKRMKVLYYVHPLLGRGGRDFLLLFTIINGLCCDAAHETPFPPRQQKPSVALLRRGWDGEGSRRSVAAARLHHHVAVLLEDDVVVAVVVEDGGCAELRGGTARLGHGLGLHQVDLGDGRSP